MTHLATRESTKSALKLIDQVAELARRLASHDFVVGSLGTNWARGGSARSKNRGA
jgi:hypothetical protein